MSILQSHAVSTTMLAVIARLEPLHDRLCPRQILGARIGLLAGGLLDLQLPRQDKRLLAFVETDGCLVDGIAEATGCRVGHRTMRIVDHGKVAATFVDTRTGRAVRVWPRPDARQRALAYAPDAPSRWHAQLDAYGWMPDVELLQAQAVELTTPLTLILSRPGIRTTCESCEEEIMNEREVRVDGRVLCRACAGETYFLPIKSPGARTLPPARRT